MQEAVNIIANVSHEGTWDTLIAGYFYFTGLSAGTFVISSLYRVFGLEKFKPIAKSAAVLAVILLLIAPILLIIHLGRPERFYTLLYHFNPTSVISWGTYLLILYPIGCLVYTYYLFKDDVKKSKLFGIISIPLAIAVHGYTGFVFGVIQARAFWYSPLMPAYFLTSAIVSGLGLVILVSVIQDKYHKRKINKDLLLGLAKLLLWFLTLDLFFVFSIILVLYNGGSNAVASVNLAIHSPEFSIGELLLGMIVPLFLLVFPKTRKSSLATIIAAILVVIFVFSMRYSVVMIGHAIPIS